MNILLCFSKAISEGLYNGDENDILSLRIYLWRLYNDQNDSERRYGALYTVISEMYKTEYADNCHNILALMNEKNEDEDFLLRAELWRNLGEFEKCKNLLAEVKKPEKYERYIFAIKAACDAENTLTVQV